MSKKTTKDKNLSYAINLGAVALGMLGMAYAFVPLYNLFCQVTGFGGTTQVSEVVPSEIIDRSVNVRFNADTSKDLEWSFKAEQRDVDIKIGENKLVFFAAENTGDETLKGTAVYNVTPLKAGGYFNKVECFCFQEQALKPGEKMTFPVSFFIDPEIVNDRNLKDVKTITLSYTFFKTKDS